MISITSKCIYISKKCSFRAINHDKRLNFVTQSCQAVSGSDEQMGGGNWNGHTINGRSMYIFTVVFREFNHRLLLSLCAILLFYWKTHLIVSDILYFLFRCVWFGLRFLIRALVFLTTKILAYIKSLPFCCLFMLLFLSY